MTLAAGVTTAVNLGPIPEYEGAGKRISNGQKLQSQKDLNERLVLYLRSYWSYSCGGLLAHRTEGCSAYGSVNDTVSVVGSSSVVNHILQRWYTISQSERPKCI